MLSRAIEDNAELKANSRQRIDWQNRIQGDEGIQRLFRPKRHGRCCFHSGADRHEQFAEWHGQCSALFAALCEEEILALLHPTWVIEC